MLLMAIFYGVFIKNYLKIDSSYSNGFAISGYRFFGSVLNGQSLFEIFSKFRTVKIT